MTGPDFIRHCGIPDSKEGCGKVTISPPWAVRKDSRKPLPQANLAERFNPCHGNLCDNPLPLPTTRFPKPFRQAFSAIWDDSPHYERLMRPSPVLPGYDPSSEMGPKNHTTISVPTGETRTHLPIRRLLIR
ncbi:hypothetical protein AVEN_105655-1 [Araneus ventricosus]|uniref:Uncharacterized protein n=1 Tax=Araneus ventricosus TaxID=182803 RepID=A0A4Y2QWA9_ARAVE|nr:hypothetical protein AVEN_105655-1 [Araneus ventricosus]